MAQIIGNGQIRLNDGKVVQAQRGGWYDGQQFWDDTLSNPGQINAKSNQQGAGQDVSREVIAQTNPQNVQYIEQQRQQQNLPSLAGGSGGAGGGGGGSAPMPQLQPVPTINLPELYEKIYGASGVRELEADYAGKQKEFNDAQLLINDNPFLSEATRTGRIQKLQMDFNNNTKSIQDQIATRKADAETKLNLELKQFDINSQAAQQAMQQFNTLLQMGAYDDASGEDIANITRSTGISSSMIGSILAQRKKGEAPQIVTSIGEDGALNVISIDKNTGRVIATDSVAGVGKVDNGKGGSNGVDTKESARLITNALQSSKNSYGHVSPQLWNEALNAYIADGVGNAQDFIASYKNYADPNRGDFTKAYGFDKRELRK